MVKDNPSDNIFNYFYDAIFRGHPLRMSILGTRKSLSILSSNQISSFFADNFNLGGVVLSAAGNIKHKDLVEKVKQNILELKEKNFFQRNLLPASCPDNQIRRKHIKAIQKQAIYVTEDSDATGVAMTGSRYPYFLIYLEAA